jgi:hypothetical protein
VLSSGVGGHQELKHPPAAANGDTHVSFFNYCTSVTPSLCLQRSLLMVVRDKSVKH